MITGFEDSAALRLEMITKQHEAMAQLQVGLPEVFHDNINVSGQIRIALFPSDEPWAYVWPQSLGIDPTKPHDSCTHIVVDCEMAALDQQKRVYP